VAGGRHPATGGAARHIGVGAGSAGLKSPDPSPKVVEDDLERAKGVAARAAVERVRPGMHLALGTGTSAAHAVRALAERFGSKLPECVASSRATEDLARSLGLPVRELRADDRFDLMIDGADEVSPALDLTKGHGGALFREKLLAGLSRSVVIIVDPTKLVDRLGTRARIPVEVVPYARPVLARRFESDGFRVSLRTIESGGPFITDNGNEILDLAATRPIEDPAAVASRLRTPTGVVETGLFVGMADRVLVGHSDGTVDERVRTPSRTR
jgi:ribose 5-phosphate isomerase A